MIGIDCVNDYYDPSLKEARLHILAESSHFVFHRLDIADRQALQAAFDSAGVDASVPVIHLAAQAGVRYGLQNPGAYIQSNVIGFYNILELSRTIGIPHLLYASSSSVYGGNKKLPFSTADNVDHPVSFYAATKKANELLAHVYSYSYNLPTTGLRFFTVYGPWGRPDMALFVFVRAIHRGEPIQVYNYGRMQRDFTYVDDIVDGIVRLIDKPPTATPDWDYENPNPATSWTPYQIYNIGNHETVLLMDFIGEIEKALGKKAIIELKPLQIGDVEATYADISDLHQATGFEPKTSIREGIPRFVEWYLRYYVE